MAKEYYEILGVNENASQDEIKKAYKKKAKKYHPDSGNEEADEEKFKKINEAYQILSDEEKRKKYDRFGKAGVNEEARREARQDFGNFEDLFSSIFGGGFGSQRRSKRNKEKKGQDLRAKVSITLKEAFEGVEKSIKVNRFSECDKCGGAGTTEEGSKVKCSTCDGSGRVRDAQRSAFGTQVTVRECPECNGMGEKIENPCNKCNGDGRHRENETISFEIPKGAESGQKLRVNGKGHAGVRGNPPGDLYVYVEVEEHELFERQEENLFYNLEISYPEASLGTKAKIPTLDGEVEIEIPEGTQSGRVFKIQNKGMPIIRRRGRGDLYVRSVVKTPKNLSDKEKELIEELKEIQGEKKNISKGFFEKMKGDLKNAMGFSTERT